MPSLDVSESDSKCIPRLMLHPATKFAGSWFGRFCAVLRKAIQNQPHPDITTLVEVKIQEAGSQMATAASCYQNSYYKLQPILFLLLLNLQTSCFPIRWPSRCLESVHYSQNHHQTT